MKKYIKKDKKKRKLFTKFEKNLVRKKGILIDSSLKKEDKQILNIFFIKNIKKPQTQIVNRCLNTARARWVFRRLRLTRMQVSSEFKQGNLVGFRKSTW